MKPVFRKAYLREVLALLMLLLAVIFFRSERKELNAILPQMGQADPWWLCAGFILTALCILFQGGMYRKSFAAIGLTLSWNNAVVLFLKRNFISIFLPAGGVSALAYAPSQIRNAGFNKSDIHQASGLFGFTGLLTVVLAGLPVLIFVVLGTHRFGDAWMGLVALVLLIAALFMAVRSIRQKGRLYQWIDKKFPSFTPSMNELFTASVSPKHFAGGVAYSMGVELCGMLHVYIAMLALGFPASAQGAAAGYIVSVLMMVISPFLRGLGAVELSMVYVLEQFGYSSTQALSITVLYRVFEFWLPLLSGLFSFAWKGRKIFLRIAPALLTFGLGIINIISAITPPIHWRLRALREYVPLSAIHSSNWLVLFVGLSLLITAAFLFRGLRSAWTIAIALAALSLVGHLTKALDYEEASLAAATVIVLIATHSQYRIRSNHAWMQVGLKTVALSFAAVMLFGFISFYFIDKKHFGIDFTWQESLLHTVNSFLLVEDTTLHPVTHFGQEFIELIRILGFFTWLFLLYTLIQPRLNVHQPEENAKEKALFLLGQFGNSSMDYFKLYKDKLYFFSDLHAGFIAYRIAGGFAVVLEEPVCAEENKLDVLTEFDRHCRKMGLKTAFYRVDENSMPWFDQLRKRKLMIGQEGILDLGTFTLEGGDMKSLRNGLSSLRKKGYTVMVHNAPHDPEFLAQLRAVSDEWLQSFEKEEAVFSQGMFDEKEMSGQDVIALHDAEGHVKTFLNIIPDYAEEECTYDLIRKSSDAPGAAMDALIVELVAYAKAKNKRYINLGMVPMTGIQEPDNVAEQIIRLAADKVRRFQHYKGLRAFKEKYATFWENKYLVYDNDFDLVQLPLALKNVMKP